MQLRRGCSTRFAAYRLRCCRLGGKVPGFGFGRPLGLCGLHRVLERWGSGCGGLWRRKGRSPHLPFFITATASSHCLPFSPFEMALWCICLLLLFFGYHRHQLLAGHSSLDMATVDSPFTTRISSPAQESRGPRANPRTSKLRAPPRKPTDSAQPPAATLLTITGSGGRLWKDLGFREAGEQASSRSSRARGRRAASGTRSNNRTNLQKALFLSISWEVEPRNLLSIVSCILNATPITPVAQEAGAFQVWLVFDLFADNMSQLAWTMVQNIPRQQAHRSCSHKHSECSFGVPGIPSLSTSELATAACRGS